MRTTATPSSPPRYRSGQSIHLRGENHLRQVVLVYDTPPKPWPNSSTSTATPSAPGPAPATDTEQRAAQALTTGAATPTPPDTQADPTEPRTETVPVYAADPGDHEALLNTFLDSHGDWEKHRTWSDETTHAIHESQTLRIERVHEADPRRTAWTVAAYETPGSAGRTSPRTRESNSTPSPPRNRTIWAGPSIDQPTWTIRTSAYTPAGLLADLAEELADGTGTRQTKLHRDGRHTNRVRETPPPASPPRPGLRRSRRMSGS
ncbi:DUF317 domain-containing protein [Streptomyces sp. NBC_01537]|uniref:DUF317 domain-containing protein n=1 Tax=Streptomyces sp. NBC_01537 TaxID=2903896 RepID=UPI003865CE19